MQIIQNICMIGVLVTLICFPIAQVIANLKLSKEEDEE